jgi:hypothetical protein
MASGLGVGDGTEFSWRIKAVQLYTCHGLIYSFPSLRVVCSGNKEDFVVSLCAVIHAGPCWTSQLHNFSLLSAQLYYVG